MSTTNKFIFYALHVVVWLIFVGLSIEAGGLIVNFVFSVFKPEMVANLYQKLDLSKMYQQNIWIFYGTFSLVLFVSILKAILFYTVIELQLKLDLAKPFSRYVAQKIERIAFYTFFIGIISHIAKEVVKSLGYYGFDIDKLNQFWVDSVAFILMAAVVYVIAIIFKRGVDLQNENDLTV
jgi:hypothetical protein